MRNSKYDFSSVLKKKNKKPLALLASIYCQRPLEVIKFLVVSLNQEKKVIQFTEKLIKLFWCE